MPSPPQLVDHFTTVTDRLLADAPDATRRKMFGYPACFTGGHMFTGLHQDRWVVRLSEPDLAALAAAGGTTFEPMPGRAMRGFLVLPRSIVDDDAALDTWLERALAHARSRPPK